MTPELFRQRYPQGGLLSDLAAVEHGQFIVRVAIEINGKCLASSLAAAATVEQAEDKARLRALSLLESGTPQQEHISTSITSSKPALSSPTTPITASTLHQAALQGPQTSATSQSDNPQALPIPVEAPLSSAPAPSSPISITNPAQPLDFSEVIARTDVELKRLGWTSEQGRTHLLETYGKRSRQLLSDDELLEFLQYLEAQAASVS